MRLLIFLLMFLTVGSVWASESEQSWKVSGFSLGMTREDIMPLLTGIPKLVYTKVDGRTEDWSIDQSPFEFKVQFDTAEGVILCRGTDLSLGSRKLLSRGDSVRKATQLLGPAESVQGLLSRDCLEDPFVNWVYKRGGGLLVVQVANDDFLVRHHMSQYCGKVWGFQLRRVPNYQK